MTRPTTSALPPVCGARDHLPTHLVARALALAPAGTVDSFDVDRDLRCTLQTHTTGDHHSLVMELPGRDTGSVWTHWNHPHTPLTLTVLPDCPATTPADTPTGERTCCEYAHHPGAHTYELNDPRHTENEIPALPHATR